ncbi:hypothetical protein Taro_043948 [Colocasia esculenta]|uniref:Uncharacterized protein n=1 Tax=Colocasia esculenta TaxID=4460 RepID=A0A843X2H5_COLES|nr:hypothetical protein [Colocasia esculenta]
MGQDRTGRIRGIGTGPTPKSLWGSRSTQKLRQDNESLKEKLEALEERMKKIESRGNNESSASACHAQKKKDSLAGRRVRILNFSGEVVASGILMSDDNDNVVMGKLSLRMIDLHLHPFSRLRMCMHDSEKGIPCATVDMGLNHWKYVY